jgi:hypothetical protein
MKIWLKIRRYALRVYYLLGRRPRDSDFEVEISTDYYGESEFSRLFFNHDGRPVYKWHHYLPIYDQTFIPVRQKLISGELEMVKFLEIGVSKGGSLEIWRKFFGKKAIIHGVDLNPKCSLLSTEDLPVHIGSQSDTIFLTDVVERMGGIDIVLDDGSHQARDQRKTFDHLFPKLSNGGLYIIEDTHTSYWLRYGGGFRRPGTGIEMAKGLVDGMHSWYHRATVKRKSLAKHEISAVHFYDSIVVIEKRRRERPVCSRQGS